MQKVELAPLDRVEVLSIMDNSVDVLMASTPVAKRAERARTLRTAAASRRAWRQHARHRSSAPAHRTQFLFDTGVTPDGVLHNLTAPRDATCNDIQALILSHGHTDHCWASAACSTATARGACPSCFTPTPSARAAGLADGDEVDLIPPSRQDLEREGIDLLIERGPSFLLDSAC